MSSNASGLHRDKQSISYIARSGLAGGIAGCVVRRRRPWRSLTLIISVAGKIGRCTA